jgi:multidrug transporter EmrE-like cation transporter
MTVDFPIPSPAPEDVALVQQVQQQWNSSNQVGAFDLLRPRAEAGEAWAAAFMAWLHLQQGVPGFEESITWAVRAADLGAPGQVVHTFNNVIGQIATLPQLTNRLPELLQWAPFWSNGVDLVGQGWNLISQGHPEQGLRVMMLSSTMPLAMEPQLNSLAQQARVRVGELDDVVAAARSRRSEIDTAASEARASIDTARGDLETKAKQAGLLVAAVLSDATNALFKADAKRNARESRFAWVAGLVVLGLAAVVALLPVTLHYLHLGPTYSTVEQIGLHLASTAALATFAGVLLTRARSRDQAAQRANDLSTAMGTMISYSNQISDPAEQQRFMTTMGQLVLQAHLTSGSKQASKDESLSGMIALLNLIKPAASAPPGQI